MSCILCSGPVDAWNASEVCNECRLLVRNLLDTTIDERWLPLAVAGCPEGIVVSDRGQVAKLLNVDCSGRYPRVSVAGRKYYLHSLVARAHIGPRPRGLLVLHADDDPQNPDALNLRYGTHAANAADRRRNRARRNRQEKQP